MSDFALARESCEEILDYSVLVSDFENGTEQRRLRHSNKVIGFKIRTPVLTYAQQLEYRNFFISKYGSLTSFTFTSPFDNAEYNVRFVENTFKNSFNNGIYQISFEFKVISEIEE